MRRALFFGNEKDNSFEGSIGAIYQTFGGKDVYPTVQEKAANLLYFITKNHSFSDGNKRIAATMFLYFLDKNGLLFENGINYLVEYSFPDLIGSFGKNELRFDFAILNN